MKDRRALIVSGTPGTGKTRFSRLLARKLGIRLISITRYAKQRNLIKSHDRRRRTYVVDERRLRHQLERHVASLKEKVLVEGHHSSGLVPTRVVEIVFVLRCSPEILRSRLRRRGYPQAKIRENVEAEVLDVCLSEAVAAHGLGKVAEIDTSAARIEDCVKEAILILAGKKPKQTGKCNWLAMLEKTGSLDQFLEERAAPWRRHSS